MSSTTPPMGSDGSGEGPSLNCDAGFPVVGLLDGEAICTSIRVFCTLVTMSVASAWFSRRKSIKMLILFFSHWLSGMVHQIAAMAEATMILICWTGENLEGLVKTFKFLELAASNMLAMTNLAVCVNLALIVSSRRAPCCVRSVSSPRLMLLSLAISVGAAAASVPFWRITVLSGSTFWIMNNDEREFDWIVISTFFLELAVGACMFLIVSWLLLFRLKEIKECWHLYTSIRFYFGLTLIGTAVNLALGLCGTFYVLQNFEGQLMIVLSWTFRHIHIALDTIVQYGVLGTRKMDERVPSPVASQRVSRTKSTSSSRSRPPRRRDSAKLGAGDRQRSSSNESNNDRGHQRPHHQPYHPRGTVASDGSSRRAVHPTMAFDNRFSNPSLDAVSTV